MKRYAIWNKKDNIITPVGEVLTPEQWIKRYPAAGVDSITVICAQGEINGAIFETLGNLTHIYEARGVDFSACATDEEKLEAIEAFEDAREAEMSEITSNEELTATALTSIAASMEFQNMMSLEDVEVV